MPHYTDLDAATGLAFLPKVWNLVIKPATSDAFFPEPWENQHVRDCAVFAQHGTDLEVLFCGEPSAVEPLLDGAIAKWAWLYGAYNQIQVCQMRAEGYLSRVVLPERILWAKRALLEQVRSKRKANGDTRPMTEPETLRRVTMIARHPVYRFAPMKYACAVYNRG